jgi:uncharacterized membrane protein YeaQ/YmgE (transglycosylase-associated protein family)
MLAADEQGLTEKAKETAQKATDAVQQAGKDVANEAEQLWHRIDNARLKNRTRDELVAWVIMGVLVGAVAGMATSLNTTGLGKLGRLFLGLAGAFIGGIVVRLANIDFGWGPVLIRYEELVISFLGAVALILLGRLVRRGATKKAGQS